MVSSVSALPVSLDVAVKLTLMSAHLNLVTMVRVAWTCHRDTVAIVPLVRHIKICFIPGYYSVYCGSWMLENHSAVFVITVQ